MNKPLPELISFLENYNRWRRGSYLHEQPVPEELGQCIDQAVEMLKSMTWQPMETAPKDREFLGVYWPHTSPSNETFAVFRYDEHIKKFVFINHSGNVYIPSINFTLFAWMEIQK